MPFLTKEELKTVAYSYQISEITEADDDIVLEAIETGTDEVASYLRRNNKKEYGDGRIVYDVDAVFAATGTDRNALILQYTKIVSLWHLLILCNVDIIYEHVKERYDRAIDFLKKVNKGDVTLNLPTLTIAPPLKPYRGGSRPKFNHDIPPYNVQDNYGCDTCNDTAATATQRIYNEVPQGDIDGMNAEFILSHEANYSTSVLNLNGVRQKPFAYTITGNILTMAEAPKVDAEGNPDELSIDYDYNS